YKPAEGLTKLPIDAIIYTHNHIDHTGGVLGYLSMADQEVCPAQDPNVRGLGGDYRARRNCVEIICQEKVVDAVVNTSTVSGRMIQARSFYMYGLLLPNKLSPIPNPKPIGEAITNGIGPYLSRGIAGFHLPSRTFAETMGLRAAGVEMDLMYVPSETNDELAVFVPDELNGVDACTGDAGCGSGLLFSAEVIQGPAFPNLYSLRGTQYRSPANWFRSVDKLRQLDSWCMVPSHGPPVCQRDNIQRLLVNFRDAIQFTHDQTVHFMNQGYKPDELAELVKVPDAVTRDLAKIVPWPNAPHDDTMRGHVHPEDYLLPFYGSVPQGVRETYFGYLGWYDGDPVNLQPTPPQVAAERMLALIQGRGDVATAAKKALADGEYQWAAELATLAIRADRDDMAARELKAKAFEELGRRALDPNWSDWYFTSANELLEVEKSGSCFNPFAPVGLVSTVTQTEVPLGDWVNSWTWQLDGHRAADAGADTILGFWFDPTTQDFGPQGYVLELRHGIAEYSEWTGTQEAFRQKVDVGVQMSQDTLVELVRARAALHATDLPPTVDAWILQGIADG
ncbi:MAG: alkyl sulfatase dimerization domain-containing protein, partial [Acidobacteriota bacterium]